MVAVCFQLDPWPDAYRLGVVTMQRVQEIAEQLLHGLEAPGAEAR